MHLAMKRIMDQYNQENSPEGLRSRVYDTRKWLGVALLVVGLGGLALAVRSFVRRRTPPPSSRKVQSGISYGPG